MSNTIAKILRIIGVLEIFAGILLGVIIGLTDGSIGFLWWGIGLVSGMIFIGFSEIIELLYSINSKLYDIDKTEYYGKKDNKENVKHKSNSEIYNSIMSDKN